MPLDRCFDVIACHFFPCRMFQGNLRVHLNGRLVLMTLQPQHRTHTTQMYKTPHQLHHPLLVPIVLRLLLTLVSNLVSILFYLLGSLEYETWTCYLFILIQCIVGLPHWDSILCMPSIKIYDYKLPYLLSNKILADDRNQKMELIEVDKKNQRTRLCIFWNFPGKQ